MSAFFLARIMFYKECSFLAFLFFRNSSFLRIILKSRSERPPVFFGFWWKSSDCCFSFSNLTVSSIICFTIWFWMLCLSRNSLIVEVLIWFGSLGISAAIIYGISCNLKSACQSVPSLSSTNSLFLRNF